MNKTETMAHGDGLFAQCQVVARFIDERVRPIVDRRLKADPTNLAYGTGFSALLRVTAWLRSLEKLNHPADFQPVVSGSRALLEIAVDLTLAHHAPAAHPHDRILAWEQSAKLKHAERIVRFYKDAGRPLPVDHIEAGDFINRQGAAIRLLRAKHWPPKGHHPDRWTGRSLEMDAREADKLASYSFGEFYATRFSPLCWSTHGSGLAGIRTLTEASFPGVSGLGFGECARFAEIAAELVLRLFGQYDAIAEVRFEQLKAARDRVHTEVFSKYPEALEGLKQRG